MTAANTTAGWVTIAVMAGLLAVVNPLPARAQPMNDSNDALVREGRALYRGERPWRLPPQLYGVALAAGATACVQCHGARGEARTEGGVPVPAIQWQRLSQPTVSRAAYASDAALLQALRESRDADGRALAAPMPRYALDPQEERALLAWLRVMGTEAAPVPGVWPDRVVLGSVLPLTGPQAEAGAAVKEALARGIERINVAGGLFGRWIDLEVADAGSDAAGASAAAARLVESGRVFALVASLLPEPDAALRRALVVHDATMVATLGQSVAPANDPRITWLLPSLSQQMNALVAALPRHCLAANRGLRVLRWRQGALASLPVPPATTSLRWIDVDDAVALRRALREEPGSATIALMPAQMVELARDVFAGPGICLGTLAVLSGGAAADAGPPELLGLPMPAMTMETSTGAARGGALWQLLADSALFAAVEAMSRTGRSLDTTRFIAALDTLQRLQPAPGLSLSFGPQRRHGFEPTWIWKDGTRHDTPHTHASQP
ncbi:cytochrome c/ABC transporter substrate-binding protein [Variovorax sp. RHLX14]|uniref:cytochrome c/ABC transporter substrate-binding protein n=1 Tax=Variovorax sp. RHLX14 TaxID=1259731 RepID=UPI003F48BCDA